MKKSKVAIDNKTSTMHSEAMCRYFIKKNASLIEAAIEEECEQINPDYCN